MANLLFLSGSISSCKTGIGEQTLNAWATFSLVRTGVVYSLGLLSSAVWIRCASVDTTLHAAPIVGSTELPPPCLLLNPSDDQSIKPSVENPQLCHCVPELNGFMSAEYCSIVTCVSLSLSSCCCCPCSVVLYSCSSVSTYYATLMFFLLARLERAEVGL